MSPIIVLVPLAFIELAAAIQILGQCSSANYLQKNRKEKEMTNRGFARIYMILAIGCFVAIILIIALYFSLKLNGISLPIVISGLVLVMLGITSFIVSRSHSHHVERNDEE